MVTTSRFMIAGAEPLLQTIRRTEVQFDEAEPIRKRAKCASIASPKVCLGRGALAGASAVVETEIPRPQ